MMRDNPLSFPCKEPTRCLLRSLKYNKQLSMSPRGEIFLSKFQREWEEWLVEESVEGTVWIRSAKHGFDLAESTPTSTHCQNNSDVTFLTQADERAQWILQKVSDGSVRLVSKQSLTKTIAVQPDESVQLMDCDTCDYDDEAAAWSLEYLSGELCFLSHATRGRYLWSNITGKIGMSDKRQAGEVWRFIEAGNGELYINAWSRSRLFLCTDHKHRVFTSMNRQCKGSKWVVSKSNTSGVWIQSVDYRRYLALDGMTPCTTEEATADAWQLDAAHCNTFFLYSPSLQMTLSHCQRSDEIIMTDTLKTAEKFVIESNQNDSYTIRAYGSRNYIGATKDGKLTMSKTVNETELWNISESPAGGVYIASSLYHYPLMGKQDELLLSSVDPNTDEEDDDDDQHLQTLSWVLQPAGLPNMISDTKVMAMVGAGVGALALSVVVPVAVVGIGSIFMEAVAAETVILGVSGGLLAGGAVIGSTAAFVPNTTTSRGEQPALNIEGQSFDDDNEEYVVNRPLCAWKSW